MFLSLRWEETHTALESILELFPKIDAYPTGASCGMVPERNHVRLQS